MRARLCVAVLAIAAPVWAAEPELRVGAQATSRLLSARTGRTRALEFEGRRLPANGQEFHIVFDGRAYTFADFQAARVERNRVSLRSPNLDVAIVYAETGLGAVRKSLRITPRRSGILEHVDVESVELPPEAKITVARGDEVPKSMGGLGRLPICAFVDAGKAGAFFSLDFALSAIEIAARGLRVGYSPYVRLAAGEEYTTHAVATGAYFLSGETQGPFDTNAAAAFRRYIRFDYAPPHWKGPQLIYTSIVNRFTEIDPSMRPAKPGETPIANTIYYTLSDANYYMLRPEKIPEEIDFARSLSMDWCQVYEGPFEWISGKPEAAAARRIGEYARDRGILLGLYTGANHLTAPHFNDYAQDKGRPEWKRLDSSGKRQNVYCWGSDAFSRWFTDVLIEASLNYGFRQANFDFLEIAPCYDAAHGHQPGHKGLYRQVLNLVRSLDAVRASVSGYTYDSNLGWPPFVPKIAPSMDAFYLNDPHFTTYFPSLNSVEALDNSRRYEMASYFLKFLTPVEYFRNCEYFITGDSVLHDANIVEYGILQGLAITPNLQLGEARALFDRLSPSDQERTRKFLARWTRFSRDHWEDYANTMFLTGLPKLGQVELYAHSRGDRSVVFAVNPNPFPREAEFQIDGSIGLFGPGPYVVRALYPEDEWIGGLEGPTAKRGEPFTTRVPARTVAVFEIGAPPAYSRPPLRVAGATASYDRFQDHYRIQVEGWQGEIRNITLFFPDGESLVRVESGGRELAAHPERGGYSVPVTFPKDRVIPDILHWQMGDGDAIDFPVLESDSPAANFLGARIENLLNERFRQELLVYFGHGKTAARPAVRSVESRPSAPLLQGNSFRYTAKFPVVYVQHYIPPPPDQHNYIALNFRRPAEVRELKAWLNGKEAIIEKYQQWRGPASAFTYYLDGTRAGLKRGENVLTLAVTYREEK